MPNEEEELRIRAQARRRQRESGMTTPTDIARSFNTGLLNTVMLPADLINMFSPKEGDTRLSDYGIGSPDAEPFRIKAADDIREGLSNIGMVNPPGTDTTLVERWSEFLGGSAPVVMGLWRYGLKAGTMLPHTRSFFQNMAAGIAEKAGLTIGSEVVSSLGAATGGKIAERYTDNPVAIALSELAGGFTPDIYLAFSPTGIALREARAQGPGLATSVNAETRAARRLQELSADPEAAAARIDPTSSVSPARQTGEQGLMQLEQTVLRTDPELRQRFSEDLQNEIADLQEQSRMFEGNNRARTILQQDVDYVLRLVNTRSRMASESAANALNNLNPNATQREISAAARPHLDEALNSLRDQEKVLWRAVGAEAPPGMASTENASKAMEDILASRTIDANPDDIPGWLVNRLRPETPEGIDLSSMTPEVRAQVEAQLAAPITLDNLVDIRSRILADIRETRATPGYNRNRVRILNEIQSAILDDMSATGVSGVDEARAFSLAINQRFTEGNVGRLMGFERAGSRSVADADTFDRIISGNSSGSTLDQLFGPSNVEMPPEAVEALEQARQGFETYLKARFLGAVGSDGATVNTRKANQFINRLDAQDVWKYFPGLREQFTNAGQLSDAATRLGVGQDQLVGFLRNGNRSALTMYLGASPGEEMNAILTSKRPSVAARRIRQRVASLSGNDQAALDGLKQSYIDELWDMSRKGTPDENGLRPINGEQFSILLNQTQGAARSLGITDDELARLNRIANEVRNAQSGAPGALPHIIDDKPARMIRLVAQIFGAKAGQKVGSGGIGSALVLSQAGSAEAQNFLQRLTTAKAERLLIDATQDPNLFRALLVRPTDSAARKAAAYEMLNAWALGTLAPLAESE